MTVHSFNSNYYDQLYFADRVGKEYRRPDGSIEHWSYKNPDGFWDGCVPIAKAWKEIFKLERCQTDSGLCKSLDIGAGRGAFIWALRNIGVEGWGFDFSEWAVENRYKGCQEGWLIRWDATVGWPYGDKSFDFTICLDLMEHIYLDDIDRVINEMFRVSKRFIFLQIGITGGVDGAGGYILKKGEDIPIQLEVNTVAGHVTVQPISFWINKLKDIGKDGWRFRDDLVHEFISKVDNRIIDNWIKNAIIILEKVG